MIKQNTAEWLTLRKSYIGASDAPILMGEAFWKMGDGRIKTPNFLFHEKLDLEDGSVSNFATKFGKENEPIAREMYEEMTGMMVAPDLVFHPTIKYMMASLDGLSVDKTRAVEIKCSSAVDHELAISGVVPTKYYAQIQHQLECLGHDEMDYFSFHKGNGYILVVKRDEQYIKEMLRVEKEFWRCVENFEEPPLTDDDYVEMDEDWGILAKSIFDMKQHIKTQKSLCESLEDELKKKAQKRNAKYGEYAINFYTRKGSIDYSSIPEIKDVDLEKYRKPSYEMSKLKMLKINMGKK